MPKYKTIAPALTDLQVTHLREFRDDWLEMADQHGVDPTSYSRLIDDIDNVSLEIFRNTTEFLFVGLKDTPNEPK